ncbi:energy-coupling factor transporter ATPase [Paenibacillus bouchesdurhonensis]|uniref:energy-coupling factor transporter ATPase n=1 Tax=Paenibacillus bouchesdurhonensis TaxID=1870990 RepID=UPI000DA5EF1F|nr:energy-coupling factor transporter ATPase [Paenibacillus bouchesdurhonensis]
MQPVISFRNFSFRYKKQSKPTLININLDILHGEKIWIAGPSGSGKSTLAHCINGLIPFSYRGEISGELYLNGQPAASLGIFERSRSVGTILQNPDAQFVGQTVGEDVAFQMENEAIPQSEMQAKVISSLDMVGMLAYESQGPHDLSGGQKQSVSLAGVLTTQADILLFDEPLANLDPVSGVRAMALIDDIHHRSGKTVIIIEHRVEDVLEQPVDRIVVMDGGEIVAVDSPERMLADGILPRHGLRQPLFLEALAYAGASAAEWSHLALAHPKSSDASIMKPAELEELCINLEEWISSIPSSPLRDSVQTDPLLEVRDVTYAYSGGRNVVRDVSFHINEGETVALLGNNGAGKSTLSGLITGLMKPRSGEITLRGENINAWSIRRRGERIGYVLQNPHQMITQHMIRDEVGLGLVARGVAAEEREERISEALRVCGLYPYRNWPVSALSFGQKKRLCIASVLVLDPALIILDEPTAGQDFRHYTEFMGFIEQLAARGTAFLFITHDMHLALEYADRAVVLADGEVIAADRVAAVLSNDEVTGRARLREDSLSRFAKACGLPEPARLVQAFLTVKKGVQHPHE